MAHVPAANAPETILLENRSLMALHLTAMDLINWRDPPDLLDAILSRAIQLMTADYGWVYLVNAREQTLDLKARVGSYHAGPLGALRLETPGAHLEALGSSGQTDGVQGLLNKARGELVAVRQALAAMSRTPAS